MTFSALLASLVLAVSATTHAAGNAEGHDHNHSGGEPQRLMLNAGRKWTTDAHLRQAMGDINQAMAGASP